MKILLVSSAYLPYTSGVSIHVYNLAKNLKALGHSVAILTTSYPAMSRDEDFPVIRMGRALFLPAFGSKFTLPVGLNLPLQVRNFLRRHNFDIVHSHGFAPPELAFFACHYSNSINVVTFHTINVPNFLSSVKFYRSLFKNHNQKIHGKIAVSKITKEKIEPLVPNQFQIIPNGIDTTKFNPNVKPLTEFDHSGRKILYVGRLEKRKGLSILLSALPEIKRKIPDVMLIVVGEGAEASHFQKLVQILKIGDSVRFVGFVPNEDLPRFYASCDLYCVPTAIAEATSIVILEAMAMGKPIVASNFPGYQELLGDNENGLLFNPKDATDLATKIIQLLTDDDLRKRFITNGLKKAKEYDWQNIAKRVETFYIELLRDFRTRSRRRFSLKWNPQSKNLSLPKKICLLYSSRKGGHRFPAEALAEYLGRQKAESRKQYAVQLFNLLDYTTIGKWLDWLARLGDLYLPKFWRHGYQHLESRHSFFSNLSRFVLKIIFQKALLRVLNLLDNKVDLILSFQPEVNTLFPLIRKDFVRKFETVIVDYSAHSLWVQDWINRYYVGNSFVAEKLKRFGVAEAKIKISGIPQKLSSLNVQKVPIPEQRKLLDLDPNLPTVTVMGGFLGKMVDYPAVIKSVCQTNFKCQMIVVFGKNKKAFAQCRSLIEKAPIPIRPYVALPDVSGVMWAADIIITKPGAVTISEALTLGKPMLLITPRAGSAQELTFAQNIEKAGVGIHIPKAELVGKQLKQLFENPQVLYAMAEKAKILGLLNHTATQTIAESILSEFNNY